ncbi:phosphotransferase [Cytobacillus sp. Hm23]
MLKCEVKHSLLTNNSIQFLLNSYDIDTIYRCDFLTKGLNDTYLVNTDRKKYIFRVYRKGWRDKSDILYELDAINHLSQSGFQVSTPIKRKDDQWLTEIHAPLKLSGLR